MLTRKFVLLCLAIFVTFATQALLTPTIPLYVASLGGSASAAGLALFAFAVPSVLVRPIMGAASDRWGGMWVLAVGVVVLALGGLLYFLPYLAGVFAASMLRGVAWGATSVGGLAVLVTVAPHHRRGEASGYYHSAMASASILFPAVALWLINGAGGFHVVFALSIALAVLAVPLTLVIRAEKEPPPIGPDAGAALSKGVNRGIILAILLNLAASIPQPTIVSFLPLYAQSLKLGDTSLYYIVSGLLTVFMRPIIGRYADSLGRGPFIAIGLAIQAVGYLMVFTSTSAPFVLMGAVITAFGPALIGGAALALAMDSAPEGARGRALATFSMTFQIGMGLGSLMAGGLADLFGLRSMYLGALLVTALGTVLLAAVWRTLPRPEHTQPHLPSVGLVD